jgi:hypothetical protein
MTFRPKPYRFIPAEHPPWTTYLLALGTGSTDTGDGAFPDEF